MAIKSIFLAFLVLGGVSALLLGYFCPELYKDLEPPELADGYYGRGKVLTDPETFPKDDPAIKSYKVFMSDSVLTDVLARLNHTRFFEPLDNVGYQYGFHIPYLKEVIEYWKTKFDWRKQEKVLNTFSHYITQIEGINVHYIHEKPKVKGTKLKVYPLLLVHGWPGSVAEFTKLIPLLTTPRKDRDYVFEVICPSIPGYGFSEAPHQTGFNYAATARVFSKLMDRLGFAEFYTHGGDWGSLITITMGIVYPNRVLGSHLTLLPIGFDIISWFKYGIGYFYPSLFMTEEEADKQYPPTKWVLFLFEKLGFLHIQGTKPDTIGVALSDSPAGLAAYILEKFAESTDPNFMQLKDCGLTKKFSLDDLLTNIMVYWSQNSITSSMRFYKEFMKDYMKGLLIGKRVIKVPVGYASFPNELICAPISFIKHKIRNLVRHTLMPRGGHFAALEEPLLLSDDIWDFVRDVVQKQEKQ